MLATYDVSSRLKHRRPEYFGRGASGAKGYPVLQVVVLSRNRKRSAVPSPGMKGVSHVREIIFCRGILVFACVLARTATVSADVASLCMKARAATPASQCWPHRADHDKAVPCGNCQAAPLQPDEDRAVITHLSSSLAQRRSLAVPAGHSLVVISAMWPALERRVSLPLLSYTMMPTSALTVAVRASTQAKTRIPRQKIISLT